MRRKHPTYYYEGCIAGVRYGYGEAAKAICSAEEWFPVSSSIDPVVDQNLNNLAGRERGHRGHIKQQKVITSRGAHSPSQKRRIYDKTPEKRNKDLDTIENIMESNPRKYSQYQKLSQSEKNRYVARINLDVDFVNHIDISKNQKKDENDDKVYKYIEGHYREEAPRKTFRQENTKNTMTKEITIDGSSKCSKYHSSNFFSPIGKEAEYISFHSKQAILDGCHIGYNSAYRKGFELLLQKLSPLYPDLERMHPSTMLKDSQSYYQSAESIYGPTFSAEKGETNGKGSSSLSSAVHPSQSREANSIASVHKKEENADNFGTNSTKRPIGEVKLNQGARNKIKIVEEKPAKKNYNKNEQKKKERQGKLEAKRQKKLAAKTSAEEYIKQYEERKYKREHRDHEQIKEIREELRDFSGDEEASHFEDFHRISSRHSNISDENNKTKKSITEKELLVNDNFNGRKYPTITVHIPQEISMPSHVTYKGASTKMMTTVEEKPSSLLAYKIPLIPNYPIEHSVVHWCRHNQPHEGSACARTVMRHMATNGLL